MIFPELSSIKSRRQKLGVKQKELSVICGISQSMIAKIESKKLSPSYEIVKKIFTNLEALEHKNEKKCSDVMSEKVISISKDQKVKEAAELMKKYGVSQMPVTSGKEIVGSISENLVYNLMIDNESKKDMLQKKISEIMQEPFPLINADYPLSIAMPLLKSSDAIILADKGKIAGILTKSNLI
jgi:predicted transcriptional regulator